MAGSLLQEIRSAHLETGHTEVPFRAVHRRYEEIHSDPDRNIVDSMEWRMPPDIAAV